MDFGICSKSFRHDIMAFHKVGDFIKLLQFLDWQTVANACKYSLNRISDERQPIIESRQ